VSKYGPWRSLNDIRNSTINSIWWRDTRSLCGNGEKGKWFNENGIDNDNKIMFWEDVWIGDMLLKDIYIS